MYLTIRLTLTVFVYIVLYLISKLTLQPEATILVYHSVSDNKSPYSISPERFKRQFKYLFDNYSIISLDEIVSFVKGEKNVPKKSVCITFDDGFESVYKVAYPLFKENKCPFTVFLTTGFCGGILPLPPYEKLLNWEQVKEMSENNVTIGVHTVNHLDLTNLDIKEVEKEILESKKEIERKTGKKVKYLAYPFDRWNWNIVNLVSKLDFEGAVNGVKGHPIKLGANRFILRRVNVESSDSFLMFKLKLTRADYWFESLKNGIKKTLDKVFAIP